jgi:hypothetical protein
MQVRIRRNESKKIQAAYPQISPGVPSTIIEINRINTGHLPQEQLTIQNVGYHTRIGWLNNYNSIGVVFRPPLVYGQF